MNVRRTLDELADLAVTQIGFCIGSRVPEGMVSARCRLAYVLFSGFAPAYRFYDLLAHIGSDILPRRNIRLVSIDHAGRTITGVAVIAVISPDHTNATGYRPAPPHRDQRGYGRFFAQQAAWSRPAPDCWDEPDTFRDDDRFDAEPQPSRADGSTELAEVLAERDDLGLEILLDQIEAAFDAKLSWYGDTQRRTKYPPALGSVAELFAYARKQELDLAEVARRNRERQADPWLDGQRQQDRVRQQALDADHAEVAAALQTPRRGRRFAEDRRWLETADALRSRRGLRYLYRDAAPRPARPRAA
jgi:hypothetical protein